MAPPIEKKLLHVTHKNMYVYVRMGVYRVPTANHTAFLSITCADATMLHSMNRSKVHYSRMLNRNANYRSPARIYSACHKITRWSRSARVCVSDFKMSGKKPTIPPPP